MSGVVQVGFERSFGEANPVKEATAVLGKPEDLAHRERLGVIWTISFAFHIMVSLMVSWSWHQAHILQGRHGAIRDDFLPPMLSGLVFGALSPFVYLAVKRYTLTENRIFRRVIGYFGGGFLFCLVDVVLRISLLALVQGNRLNLTMYRDAYVASVASAFVLVYVPIVIICHAVILYGRSKAEAMRASRLEDQLTRTELQLLKAQLNPHFLFNTMNSISELMHTNVAAADRMMARLGDFLRMALNSKAVSETTLAAEVAFARSYLSIEQIRLGDRLTVKYFIAQETSDALVPHLLLQPLVENAVKHGISKRSTPGVIAIGSRRIRKQLLITVRDNGPGCRETASWRTGVGLNLTHSRLQALYGQNYKLEWNGKDLDGTEVVLEIPFRVAEGGEPGVEDVEPC
ncbi:MAG: histidine kinase [Acidobacteria bacterium]|nr:histidine kinase [Acidobacteriota bacterium]